MTMRKPVWFMVASHHKARLMKGELTPIGRCRVQEQASLEHEGMEKDYQRPSPRMGRSGSAQDHHTPEESASRFARKVATELEKMMVQHGIEGVTLFAPPRMVGALKKAISGRMAQQVEVCQADLAHLDDSKLAQYAPVMNMVQNAPPVRRFAS